jgi:hypothetical protein
MKFSNPIMKAYPANYPALISGRSRIWPDIRPEPELSSGATLVCDVSFIYCYEKEVHRFACPSVTNMANELIKPSDQHLTEFE